jgi:hypothetical protein
LQKLFSFTPLELHLPFQLFSEELATLSQLYPFSPRRFASVQFHLFSFSPLQVPATKQQPAVTRIIAEFLSHEPPLPFTTMLARLHAK